MKLADILLLIKNSQSPQDWVQVDNESGDGGYTTFCVKDVLLCLSLNLVWKANKPFTRLQVTYGSTIISWGDLPVVSSENLPDSAQIIAAAGKQLSGHLARLG